MNLSTTYLGLKLRTPLVPAASPLSENIDDIKKMEDAGASAVVLYSLFEEQLRQDRAELHQSMEQGTESYAEALTYFPEPNLTTAAGVSRNYQLPYTDLSNSNNVNARINQTLNSKNRISGGFSYQGSNGTNGMPLLRRSFCPRP